MDKVLVVAAHPDDEVLGCGATMAKHVEHGDHVKVLVMGQGISSRQGVSDAKKEIRTLKDAALKANKCLGVKDVMLLDFPDNAFDSRSLLDLVHAIEGPFSDFGPSIVYTHHLADVNVDHQYVGRAMQAVCRPLPGCTLRKVFSFEIASSSEWSFANSDGFRPNVFQKTEGQMEKKFAALSEYASEMRPFPHPRSKRYLQALSETRGAQAGFENAEAFQLVFERLS